MSKGQVEISEPRFCAVVAGKCPFPVEMRRDGITLAYSFLPWKKSWAEEVAAGGRARGVTSYLPHEHFSSNLVFCDVCQEIRSRPTLVADASDPNWNVFFEAGFAFGSGKTVVLAEDANIEAQATRAIFSDYLRATYHEKGELITKLLEAAQKGSFNISQIVAYEQPRQFYFIDPGIRSDEVREIKRMLTRQRGATYASTDGGMLSPANGLHAILRDLVGAGAVIGLLLRRDYKDQDIINTRASFFLGVAVALMKPVLILRQEPVAEGPIDFKESARTFTSLATMRSLLTDWAEQIVAAKPEQPRRPKRIEADVLKIDLGNAWAERDPWLSEYFLETPQYRRARDGKTTVFLGRRGSGKSAVGLQLTDSDKQGHGMALGVIRPAEFEMQELQDAYKSVAESGAPHWKLLLGTIWRYLLLSQLARTYITYFSDKAEEPPELRQLRALLERIPHEEDFVDAVLAVTAYLRGSNEDEVKSFRAEMGRDSLFAPFLTLSRKTPARLVIDGIEEGWSSHHEVSQFVVASLIRQTEHLNQRFSERISVVLFIRSEIYDVVKLADPDIDKQSRERLQWDAESLIALIGLRLNYLLGLGGSAKEAWLSVFPSQVRGIFSPDYMVRMTLRRPRELIKFCAAAIEQAQARQAKQVSESDVLAAEPQYSEDLLADLNGEYVIELPDLFSFMAEFSGHGWPMEMESLRATVRAAIRKEAAAGRGHEWHGNPDDSVDGLIRRLYGVGIFGLSFGEQEIFVFDRKWDAAKAALRRPVQVRYKKKAVRKTWPEPLLVLHPALRSVLGAYDRDASSSKLRRNRP